MMQLLAARPPFPCIIIHTVQYLRERYSDLSSSAHIQGVVIIQVRRNIEQQQTLRTELTHSQKYSTAIQEGIVCFNRQGLAVTMAQDAATNNPQVPSKDDGARQPTSERYNKAKATVSKATGHFPEVSTIGAREVLQLQQEGKRVVLVDVRTDEEIAVSVLRGAITREKFESSRLGEAARSSEKFQEHSAGDRTAAGEGEVIVPYCTVGYRSGQYAKKLKDLGYPSVRNSEGVVLWTHDVGGGFVAAAPEAEAAAGAEIAGGMSGGASTAAATTSEGSEVKRVHVYGSPWDYAREDFEAVKFTPTGWVRSAAKSAFSKLFRR